MFSDYETSGGAAIAASRLAQGLVDHGHGVTRVVMYREGGPHAWRTLSVHPERLTQRVVRDLAPRGHLDPVARGPALRRMRSVLAELRPDVINLHGAARLGWGPQLVAVAGEFAPIVWTLHDMWSFTGFRDPVPHLR